MDRKYSVLSALGLVAALGAGALMGAGPLGDDDGAKGTKSGAKDKHAGHDHDKDGKETKKAAKATVGEKAPDFQFTDVNGKGHSLAEFAGKTVVLEWINPGCPICKGKMEDGSVGKMITASKAADPNVVFIFVNSTNPGMGGSAEGSAKYLKDNKVEAIAFWEGDGAVGKLYAAKTTPHCYVIDPKGVLAYSGAIDDEKDGGKGVNYVVNAVTAIKAGSTPAPASTKPYGCSVKYAK